MKKMKKPLKITIFILLTIVLLVNIWFALWFITKEPYYENFYAATFRKAYADTVLSSEEALKDMDYYISEIKTYHPQAFLFMTKEEFDNKTAEIKSEISEKGDITVEDLYIKMSELVGLLGDSHTWIYPPQDQKAHFLPFSVIYRDGKFYNSSEKSNLPYKAEILSIDDIPSEQLYDLIAKHSVTPLQGGTNRFVEKNFSKFVPLLLGYEERYTIDYSVNDKVYTKRIEGVTTAHHTQKKQIDYYEFDYDGKRIPVLELNSFNPLGNLDIYEKTVAEFFKKYVNSEAVVIDIRNNGGGSSGLGLHVFNYFADDTYKVIDDFNVFINDRVKAFYKFAYELKMYQAKIPSAFWGLPLYNIIPGMEPCSKILNAENGETLSLNDLASAVKNPIKETDRYKGKVYLLISGNTGSAAINFATSFKYNFKNGAAIGQETRHPESFSGNISKYYLPYSGIGYTIPHTFGTAPGDKTLMRGVIPDYEIELRIEDYDKDRDPELEFVVSKLL